MKYLKEFISFLEIAKPENLLKFQVSEFLVIMCLKFQLKHNNNFVLHFMDDLTKFGSLFYTEIGESIGLNAAEILAEYAII